MLLFVVIDVRFCFVSACFLVLWLLVHRCHGQHQYFRIQPRDVKVQEGGEALLECEVANVAGQVQWTKDGFALGELHNDYL